MAFLDNSGDILLDVVLTSEGRKRLAGGTFKPTKFALGDQEINYGLYDGTNTSGSAYYDLTILQTPVEIAHTDASISLQSKLFTLTSVDGDPQILYLPQLKLDDGITDRSSALASLPIGFIDGRNARLSSVGIKVRTPLGINSAISNNPQEDPFVPLDPSLDENKYNITLDNRFLQLVQPGTANGTAASIVASAATSNLFSGDEFLRTYPVSKAGNPTLFAPGASTQEVSPFKGPSTDRALASAFVVNATNQDNMFTTYKIGNVTNYASSGVQMEVIQTSVKVATFAYGYTITVPLEVIRKV